MTNKVTKLLGITLMGAALFACSPSNIYAQYSQLYPYGSIYGNNYYNYTPLTVTTTNALNVSSSGAILNGLVNGSSLYSTYNISAWFEYGTTTNLEFSTARTPYNGGYASFSANISNLSQGTTYYFRAVAQSPQNPQGIVYGVTNSFRTDFASAANAVNVGNNNTTPATLTALTEPASYVATGRVQLNSLILNPANDYVNTWFEYGTSFSLGINTVPIAIGNAPSVKHINEMTGLSPGTTYYFRAVVENSVWKNNGSILSFTTPGIKPTASIIVSAPVVITGTDTVIETNTNEGTTASTESSGLMSSVLGANVTSAGDFFPINIFGWTILLILILVLILLFKHPQARFGGSE